MEDKNKTGKQVSEDLAHRLRSLMDEHGTSQNRLAKALGIAQSQIQATLSRRQTTTKYLFEIADYFNVSARWLFNGKGSRNKEDIPISINEIATISVIAHDEFAVTNTPLPHEEKIRHIETAIRFWIKRGETDRDTITSLIRALIESTKK